MIKEKEIVETYDIHPYTMALLPAAHTDYQTIALEPNQKWYVKKPPLALIKEGCLEGGSTYDGRRVAVQYLAGARNKVPIPINPNANIYAFPTHSATQFPCAWIFHSHVKSIQPHPNPNSEAQSIITFQNNQSIELDVSYYVLEKQMQRTSFCYFRFQQGRGCSIDNG